MKKKYKCSQCPREIRTLLMDREGNNLCRVCWRKQKKIINISKPYISLEKALSKTYEIKSYAGRNNLIYVPSILEGCKVKLQLVE